MRSPIEGAVALYPPREGFGEVEPHLEVAGERVETLERVARGEVRTLVTTARAILERTRLPAAVRNSRLELRPGDNAAARRAHRASRVASASSASRSSTTSRSSACAAGSSTSTASGWRIPCASSSGATRSRRSATSISPRSAPRAMRTSAVDPAGGWRGSGEDDDGATRGTVADLFPPDTLIVVPARSHLDAEMRRTWDEAAHHIDLARRRGEDVPRSRRALPDARRGAAAARALRSHRDPASRCGHRRRRAQRGHRLPDPSARSRRPRHQAAAPARVRRDADRHPLRQRRPVRATG